MFWWNIRRRFNFPQILPRCEDESRTIFDVELVPKLFLLMVDCGFGHSKCVGDQLARPTFREIFEDAILNERDLRQGHLGRISLAREKRFRSGQIISQFAAGLSYFFV